MNFEQHVLQLVSYITTVRAYFFEGTMFLETQDSEVATRVYSILHSNLEDCGIIYGKCGQSETSYDFV